MRIRSGVFSFAFLSTSFLPAQNSTLPVTSVFSSAQGCPVSLSVRRWFGGGLRAVEKGTPEAEGRALFLRFARPEAGAIKQATVVVHGYGIENRVVPAASQHQSLSETYHLQPASGSASLTSAEVSLQKIRNVEWVELTELRYENDSLWHASAGATCHVTPDGFLLVASRP